MVRQKADTFAQKTKNMKKLSFLCAFALASMCMAQDKTAGAIQYTQTVKLQIRLEGADEAMLQNMPKTQTSKFNLFFTANESLYKAPEEQSGDIENNEGGVRMMIRRPQNIIYRNFSTQKKVEQREFAGKKFLIEGDLATASTAWKLTGETKTILGYDCQKATFVETDGRKRNLVAWFTDAIPAAMGPDTFGSLPGTILEVDINNGENVTTASKIDFRAISADEVKAPSSGKKVTDAEFRKIVEDYMKENGMQGGGTNMRVIIRN